jgi:hypothetical protein
MLCIMLDVPMEEKKKSNSLPHHRGYKNPRGYKNSTYVLSGDRNT